LAGLSIFPEEVLLGSVPFAVSAVAVSAGHGPERWVHPATDRETGYLFWGLLVGVDESVRSALASAVERGPLIAEAIAAAVLAASVGDDTLREAALTALPESSWTGAYGQFGGAATPEEARRSAQAVSLMRIGEAQRAIDLLAESLAQPSYDALTPYLMGEAQAAAGAWSEAIRYWETLLRTSYRPHVRLRLGEAYENNGDTTAAIESYRGFLAMWQEGDPALPPAVEATEALARLGG
jgi:tetratricopeptide (TPR) repeat protein